jgi:hypothetical protein
VLVGEADGNFDIRWPRGQDPNPDEPIVRVHGSMSDTEFNATLECYPGGELLTTLTASRQGGGYTGSFSGGTFRVDPPED